MTVTQDQPTTVKPDITIFRGWADFGKHVWSPYVIKLEARLRFANVPYRTAVGSPRTAPRGKIPYIEYNSGPRASSSPPTAAPATREQLSDSTLIIKTLAGRGVIPDLDAGLAPARRTHDLALRSLLEDKLYFYHTHERWIQNYHQMRDHVLQSAPYPARLLVGLLIHRDVTAALRGQGTGRYSADEVAAFRREIWDGVDGLLAEARSSSSASGVGAGAGSGSGKPPPFWVLGGDDGPTEADACLFGFVVSVLICTACPDSQEVVKSYPVILEYAERIHDRYFPDYEKWTV